VITFPKSVITIPKQVLTIPKSVITIPKRPVITMPKSVTYFAVAFKGPWTDEPINVRVDRKLAVMPRRPSPARL
jgi:hypothetical protein